MEAVTEVPIDVVIDLIRLKAVEPLRDWLSSENRDITFALNNAARDMFPLLSTLFIYGPIDVDQTSLVKELIARGADVRRTSEPPSAATCPRDDTPLHHCNYCGEAAALLDAGADIDATTSDGETALFYAAGNHRVDVVRLLLRRGADITRVDIDGRDALDHALDTGDLYQAYFDTVDLLIDVNAAGTWKSYVNEPRVALVRLRLLCARGRARPPSSNRILQRLFAPGTSKNFVSTRISNRPLPNGVFWHVLSFWRTSRDD